MKKFKKTYIEITNICNLSCDFCPRTARPIQFMSPFVFEKILRKIKGHSEHIYFHVMGEPLMHPDIGVFLDLSLEHGFKVNLTTNGTLINRAGVNISTKAALRQVNFSLHSFEGNSNDYAMDSYLDNIFFFIREVLIQRDLLICLRLWNLSDDGGSGKNRHILHRIEKEFNLAYTIEEKLTPCRGVKISENIFLNQAALFCWPEMERDDIGDKGFCYGLREQIAILTDGTVVPCCLDGEGIMKLGNIMDNELSHIIESKRATDIYNGFSKREVAETLCRKCGYRTRFGNG